MQFQQLTQAQAQQLDFSATSTSITLKCTIASNNVTMLVF